MSANKYRTREEWFMLAKEMMSSGQTQRMWCDEHDINVMAMRSYMKRSRLDLLKSSDKKSKEQALCWVEVNEISSDPSNASASALEVFVGPGKVKVPRNFDSADFAEICKVLMSLC
jgi:hypothetical protein